MTGRSIRKRKGEQRKIALFPKRIFRKIHFSIYFLERFWIIFPNDLSLLHKVKEGFYLNLKTLLHYDLTGKQVPLLES